MDFALLNDIQEHLRTPALDAVMPFVTHLADFALIWLLAAAVLLAQPKRRVFGIALVIAVALTVIVNNLVLKNLFDRPRPFAVEGAIALLVPPPSGASFPSSHAMVSFAAAAVLCSMPERGKGAAALKVGSVLLACLIAFSRLYLYVHFPTDVVAGALVGVGIGLVSVYAAKRLAMRAPPSDGPES